jgi:hypothetical protein
VLTGRGTIKELKPERGSPVMSIESSADRRGSLASILLRCSEDLDKETARRIAQNAAARRLPAIRRAMHEAQQVKRLAGMAAWAGDTETEESLTTALEELATAANL